MSKPNPEEKQHGNADNINAKTGDGSVGGGGASVNGDIVYGNKAGGDIAGRNIYKAGNIYNAQGNIVHGNNVERQSLAEALKEIQQLLQQLEETYPQMDNSDKVVLASAKTSVSLRSKVIGALGEGWQEVVKEVLDSPYVNVALAMINGWMEAK